MAKKYREVLYDTPETLARHKNYMDCWNAYRERDRTGSHRFGNVHADYNQTLKESGMPGDYRLSRYELESEES
jgi:hypothetical protein